MKPRDIYNRRSLLKRILKNLDLLDEPDRTDILKFVQYMNDNRNADLTVVSKVGRLITLREKLNKPFRETTETDLRNLFIDIETVGWKRKTKNKIQTQYKKYSAAADEKFRKVIKEFYKIVFGNGEVPQQVKWIKTKTKKDNMSKRLDFRKVLSQDQVVKLVEITQGLQRKNILGVGYELRSRPEEFLRLTNLDIRFEEDAIYCMLRGKTGEREIKVVEYLALFKQWLENHPLKHQKIFPIWISEATNRKNRALGLRGAEKIAEEMIPKVDPTKIATLYTLRHSRATFLAKCGLNEPALRLYFGRDEKSDEPATYKTGEAMQSTANAVGQNASAEPIINESAEYAAVKLTGPSSAGPGKNGTLLGELEGLEEDKIVSARFVQVGGVNVSFSECARGSTCTFPSMTFVTPDCPVNDNNLRFELSVTMTYSYVFKDTHTLKLKC